MDFSNNFQSLIQASHLDILLIDLLRQTTHTNQFGMKVHWNEWKSRSDYYKNYMSSWTNFFCENFEKENSKK